MLDTLQTYLQTATPEELQEMYDSLKCWLPVEKSLEERERKYASQYLHPILYEEAKKFYRKIALEQRDCDIDKSCKWFNENAAHYIEVVNGVTLFNGYKMLCDYRKVMEE